MKKLRTVLIVVLIALALVLFFTSGHFLIINRPQHADAIVVTSDNPRSEQPAEIIADIAAGVSTPYEAIEDRREAIAHAIASARTGDVVLLAVKGHEAYQEAAGQRLPFSDSLEAERALAGWSR